MILRILIRTQTEPQSKRGAMLFSSVSCWIHTLRARRVSVARMGLWVFLIFTSHLLVPKQPVWVRALRQKSSPTFAPNPGLGSTSRNTTTRSRRIHYESKGTSSLTAVIALVETRRWELAIRCGDLTGK